jgi:hypothetical protein
MARQITIRNPTPELTRLLKAVAEARGESLNTTVLRLLAESVGFEERRERLERWATWNEEDAAEFDAALRAQRIVDEQLWR